MRPILFVLETGAGPSPIRANVLDQTWLNNIRHCLIPEARCASETKLIVSGTISLHLCMGESHVRVTCDVVDKRAIPV